MSAAQRQARVIGLGLCVRDEVFLVDDFGLVTERTRYRAHHSLPGGMVANALVAAAEEGAEAHILTMLGQDADGRFLASQLRKRGIVTRKVQYHGEHETTTSVVLVERSTGERRFLVPDRRALERDAPDFDLSSLRAGSVLMIDGHFPDQVERAWPRAREKAIPIVADFSDARPAFRRLLAHVDYPVLPLDFVRSYGAGGIRETLRALYRRYGCTPVITRGEKGAVALVDGKFLKVPPVPVRVIDTTGAGDAFHGAFAAGLAQRLSLPQALRQASRRAAHRCRQLGGVPSV